MRNLIWHFLAKLLARPAIANWLIKRAERTPYMHITSADGQEIYMGRWWLLNPYTPPNNERKYFWFPWSVRIHHIMRADHDRDLHDHPWDARTVILKGWYVEQRLIDPASELASELAKQIKIPEWARGRPTQITEMIDRRAGDTARLNHGEYHRIDEVSPGGVFTLFITNRYAGVWGFLVDGKKVPWREYLADRGQPLPQAPAPQQAKKQHITEGAES